MGQCGLYFIFIGLNTNSIKLELKVNGSNMPNESETSQSVYKCLKPLSLYFFLNESGLLV